MPSPSCAAVSMPVGSTLTRTTAVRMRASLSPAGREPGQPHNKPGDPTEQGWRAS